MTKILTLKSHVLESVGISSHWYLSVVAEESGKHISLYYSAYIKSEKHWQCWGDDWISCLSTTCSSKKSSHSHLAQCGSSPLTCPMYRRTARGDSVYFPNNLIIFTWGLDRPFVFKFHCSPGQMNIQLSYEEYIQPSCLYFWRQRRKK